MRAALVALLLAPLLVDAVSAAGPHPRALVLAASDVPRGFVLDRDQSGVRSNAEEAKTDPRLPALFQRWGRVTGYEAEYDRGSATIGSRADLLRSRAGARELLSWYDREVRKAGMRDLKRSSARLGNQAWVYRASWPAAVTIVVWRQDRVFAGVLGEGISRARTLALAHTQERRIAAAL